MKTRSKRQVDVHEETSLQTEVTAPVVKKSKGNKATDKAATSKTSKSGNANEAPKDQNVNGDRADRTSVWLMKSEPDTFSIDALIKSKDSTSQWDGVVRNRPLFLLFLFIVLKTDSLFHRHHYIQRNHEAKNLMKLNMKIGDTILFYHSNTKEPGIVGMMSAENKRRTDACSSTLVIKHDLYHMVV